MKMPSLVKKQPGAKQLLVLSAPFLATDPSVYPMDQFYIHELTKGLNADYPDVLVVSETAFGGMSWQHVRIGRIESLCQFGDHQHVRIGRIESLCQFVDVELEKGLNAAYPDV